MVNRVCREVVVAPENFRQKACFLVQIQKFSGAINIAHCSRSNATTYRDWRKAQPVVRTICRATTKACNLLQKDNLKSHHVYAS